MENKRNKLSVPGFQFVLTIRVGPGSGVATLKWYQSLGLSVSGKREGGGGGGAKRF